MIGQCILLFLIAVLLKVVAGPDSLCNSDLLTERLRAMSYCRTSTRMLVGRIDLLCWVVWH